jgi:hypothetical protein
MRWLAFVGLLASCGRLDFNPVRDSTPAVDAPPPCMPLPAGVTVQNCSAAYAAPEGAPDQLVWDCAHSCEWGQCVVHDPCPTCACQYYAKSSVICDPMGNCGPPINGTGCLGLGFSDVPPFNCTSNNGLVYEGACMMRALEKLGAC